jgi:hypothetical protein
MVVVEENERLLVCIEARIADGNAQPARARASHTRFEKHVVRH